VFTWSISNDIVHQIIYVDNSGFLNFCLDSEFLSQYLFVVGMYTTSMILKWAMAELFQNPANMTKAQQEIKKEEFDIA
jgi:hypothetical protein